LLLDSPAHRLYATHSLTGAFASCSGWQMMSTSVGSPASAARFRVARSSAGSSTRQLLTPYAAATAA